MAQERRSTQNPNRPNRGNRPAGAGAGSRPPSTGPQPGAGPRPPRKPGKSIVNQKQTPWGMIITIVVLVAFAAGIVIFAVTSHSSSKNQAAASSSTGAGMSQNAANKSYVRPEIAAAKKIKGIIYKAEPNHDHVNTIVKYDMNPPIGGNHSPYWAECDGTVYTHQIANENAVHMLEHGAVWITYDPTKISGSALSTLQDDVRGVDGMALTPYADLYKDDNASITLQAWDYQLRVNSADDPRIGQFIDTFRQNPATTPEAGGICQNTDGFDAAKSTPGHPFEG